MLQSFSNEKDAEFHLVTICQICTRQNLAGKHISYCFFGRYYQLEMAIWRSQILVSFSACGNCGKQNMFQDSSPGYLLVMTRDSCTRDCEFESQCL